MPLATSSSAASTQPASAQTASTQCASGQVEGDGPLVLIHGGAWDIPDADLDAYRQGLERGLRVAQRATEAGHDALAVVVEVVAALENHPAFDAGKGSVLDRDGLPQLDAGLMDGTDRQWGAVANVRGLANPIRAARALLHADGQARLLVGEGAERFAAEQGLPAVDPTALIVARERDRYDRLLAHPAFTSAGFAGRMDVPRGTVGCVVRDAGGRLAAGTSTGGAPLTRSGRVGDSPIPGAGFVATPQGAASATGWGEAILAVQLSADALHRLRQSHPAQAARDALATMADTVRWAHEPATGGLIVVDAQGRAGWAFSTPRMARAWWRPGQTPGLDV